MKTTKCPVCAGKVKENKCLKCRREFGGFSQRKEIRQQKPYEWPGLPTTREALPNHLEKDVRIQRKRPKSKRGDVKP